MNSIVCMYLFFQGCTEYLHLQACHQIFFSNFAEVGFQNKESSLVFSSQQSLNGKSFKSNMYLRTIYRLNLWSNYKREIKQPLYRSLMLTKLPVLISHVEYGSESNKKGKAAQQRRDCFAMGIRAEPLHFLKNVKSIWGICVQVNAGHIDPQKVCRTKKHTDFSLTLCARASKNPIL